MNQEMINLIMYQMQDSLDNQQLMLLKEVLERLVEKTETGVDDSEELLAHFIATKRLEGRSEKTLTYYRSTVEKILAYTDKNVRAITTNDIRDYLSDYQSRPTVSKQTVDNVRRNLSSFFNWLEDENYILKSPVRRIHKIKASVTVKEAYSDDEMELLSNNCT